VYEPVRKEEVKEENEYEPAAEDQALFMIGGEKGRKEKREEEKNKRFK